MTDEDAKRRFRHAYIDEFRRSVGLRTLSEENAAFGLAPLRGHEPTEEDRRAARDLIAEQSRMVAR